MPDEERSEPGPNCTEMLVADGLRADFVICGEPTDMQVGVQAKGVLMMRAEVEGVAAHGSTPWLGRSAILDGVEMYRAISELPFATESTELFTQPSINLGRIKGGDAINKVPDDCRLDIDVRYLPGPGSRRGARADPRPSAIGASRCWSSARRHTSTREHRFVALLLEAVGAYEPTATSVGRDGASDVVAFLEVGVPAVEFGPRGAGHHGPAEYVEAGCLASYRRALTDFARLVGQPGRGHGRGGVRRVSVVEPPAGPPQRPLDHRDATYYQIPRRRRPVLSRAHVERHRRCSASSARRCCSPSDTATMRCPIPTTTAPR